MKYLFIFFIFIPAFSFAEAFHCAYDGQNFFGVKEDLGSTGIASKVIIKNDNKNINVNVYHTPSANYFNFTGSIKGLFVSVSVAINNSYPQSKVDFGSIKIGEDNFECFVNNQ